MRYLLLFAGDQEAFNAMGPDDAQAMFGRIGEWWAKHSSAGTLVSGEQLEPPSTASTLRHTDGGSYVVDGPFIEAKEHIGGFAVVNVATLDEALELARTWPAGGSVEVRRVVERN
ncbi:MAG: YciI family protein [Candidatus Dormiibacterota bacterium]